MIKEQAGLLWSFPTGEDVLPVDALVFIEEEDREGGGIDEFLDLVFAEIAEEAGSRGEGVVAREGES
jgi:hypothetical protein